MPAGMMPAAIIAATQAPALSTLSKPMSSARAVCGPLQDPHRGLSDDAEQALRADDQPEQIVVAAVEMLAAETHDVALAA